MRYLPVELVVRKGDVIEFIAEHSSDDVTLYVRAKSLPKHAVADVFGHELPGERTHAVCVSPS